MTNKEALEILYKGIAPDSKSNDECIKLCKKALEKQIPKNIDTNQERCFGCKLCGFKLQDLYWNEEDYDGFKDSLQYCPHCGQRIAWKED